MVVAKQRIPRKIKEFSFFNIGLFNYFTAVNSNPLRSLFISTTSCKRETFSNGASLFLLRRKH